MIISQIKQQAENYGLKKLSEDSGISRAQIHKILSGNSSPSLETLTKLLAPLNLSLKLTEGPSIKLNLTNIEDLKFAMAYYGAPLLITPEDIDLQHFAVPDIKTVMLHALKRGRSSGDINTILPIFIHRNLTKVDLQSLIEALDDLQYYGYILDLLYRLTNNRKYLITLSHLKIENTQLRKVPLIKGMQKNKFQENYFARSDNPVAKCWKFSTGDSFNDIKRRFDKWVHKERS